MANDQFGKLIAERRRAQKVSIHRLAKKTDVSSGYISRIERGDVRAPSLAVASTMATALNIDEDVWRQAYYASRQTLPIQTGNLPVAFPGFIQKLATLPPERINEIIKSVSEQYQEFNS